MKAPTHQEDTVSDARAQTTSRTSSRNRSDGSVASSEARRRLLANLPVTERRLSLNGISTAVLEGGEGPPIVLLHGPGEYGAKWIRVIPKLVREYRVVAPDLPGHGASAPVEGALDVDRIIGWLDDLIDCTCATPPIVVGQIVGGAIAARFAARHSDRIRQLVLVDSLGLTPFHPSPEFGQAMMAYLSSSTSETYDDLWARCAFDVGSLRDRIGTQWSDIKAYSLECAAASALHGTQRSLMEQFGFPAIPSAELQRIAVPTTLIWGRHDVATPLSAAEAASSVFGWPLHVIDQAGDDPPMEQPDAFLDALRTAVANRDSRAAAGGKLDTRPAWDHVAPGYDRTNTSTQMRIASEGLRLGGLRESMSFLDVGAGSGALSIPAARMRAQVTAIDQSPAMLGLLAKREHQEGLTIETRVMDGHALQFDDESFDMTGSQFGVMLFPDMPRAIREMARVTKRGGRVLIHAYGDPHRIEFLSFFVAAVQAVRSEFNGPPADPPPLEFQLADPERLRHELAAAGLRDVAVKTLTETTEYSSGSDLWDWIVWSNPLVEHILGDLLALTEGERA